MTRVVLFDAARREWITYEQPLEVVEAQRTADVVTSVQEVERYVQDRGMVAVGFISYEAAPAFDAALKVCSSSASFPLVWFALFDRSTTIHLPPPSSSAHPLSWRPNISREEYQAAIKRIKRSIAEGDTYQVNYTFRLTARFEGSAFDVFLRLVQAQPSPYCAFIETNDFSICSTSPELFFSLEGEEIVTRPMKGTASRACTVEHDDMRAESLRTSEKNRAENVMIVDMMRNDLGRIAEIGSVQVPSLFDVERYPTVWQMTSTVTATTKASLTDILRALFPCASVTGAPKARTMEIIAELERTPRQIYTGAIGVIAPNRRARFSVAIRTVLIDKKKNEAEYGVGGGVVWHSTAEDEYEECLTKARVLTDVRPDFELVETMLFTQQQGFFLLEEHLNRLRASARYFDLPFDEPLAMRMIRQLHHDLRASARDCRVRMVLHRDGTATFAVSPIEDAPHDPLRVKLAAAPIDSNNLFLYHKTTHRKVYDDALASISDCDDVILWNERGEVTESSVANIVAEIDGKLYTPPVSCGVLAGTFRAVLLKEGTIAERVIRCEHLTRATQLFLINSVRRWRKAVLV